MMDINELLQDNEFRTAIEEAESVDQIAKVFQSKGFAVTVDDVKKAVNAETGEEEINEQELETVAGGLTLKFNPVLPFGYKALKALLNNRTFWQSQVI